MTATIFSIFFLPLVLGFIFSFLFIPKDTNSEWTPQFFLRLGLGWGLGCGLWSCFTYLGLRFSYLHNNRLAVEWTIFLTALVLFIFRLYRGSNSVSTGHKLFGEVCCSSLDRILALLLIVSFLIGLSLQLLQSLNQPYGNWDAWSFWNLRASFILKHFPDWMIAFDIRALNSNLEYPLLIPTLVYRMWDVIGSDNVVVPIGIGIGFTISCALVLVGGIWILNGRRVALISGTCLISAKMFLVCGADQYCDVPLAYYFLSALVTISLSAVYPRHCRSLLLLAGILLGLATWTKNEGQLVALSTLFSGVLCFVVGRHISLNQACFMLVGFFPVFGIVADFKINIAPQDNAYIGVEYWPRISSQLLQFDRYIIIAKRFVLELFTFHRWGYVSLFLFFYAAVVGFKREAYLKPFKCMAMLSILLILGGYFGIYVITPQDINVHIDTSLNRLMVHVFPAIIFSFFLNAEKPSVGLY